MKTLFGFRFLTFLLGFISVCAQSFSAPAGTKDDPYPIYVVYVKNGSPTKDPDSIAALKGTVANLNRGAETGKVYIFQALETIEQARTFMNNDLPSYASVYLVTHGVYEAGRPEEVFCVDMSENSTPAADVRGMGFKDVFYCGRWVPGQKVNNNQIGHAIKDREGGTYRNTIKTADQGDGMAPDSEFTGLDTVWNYVYQYYMLTMGIYGVWVGDGDAAAWWQHWVPETTQAVWIDGHYDWGWVPGQYNYGWDWSGEWATWYYQWWNSNYYYDTWDYWFPGHWDWIWIDGYTAYQTVPGHWED